MPYVFILTMINFKYNNDNKMIKNNFSSEVFSKFLIDDLQQNFNKCSKFDKIPKVPDSKKNEVQKFNNVQKLYISPIELEIPLINKK